MIAVSSLGERLSTTGDFLVVVGALLGVVFAAFALVISLLSDTYLKLLDEDGRLVRFLDPFIIAAGIQVAVVVGAVAYRAIAEDLAPWVEHGAFTILSFLFVFALIDVIALGRNLLAHALLRAKSAALDDERTEGD